MPSMNRRRFLQLSGAGLSAAAASTLISNPFMGGALQANALGPTAGKKLIYIFLRGGNDGINTIIPHGDSDYNNSPTFRPTLFIDPLDAIDLGNGFASMHPAMSKMHEVFQANDLAVLHRIAYEGQSRSHFSSQHYWENAKPNDLDLEEGWLNRVVANNAQMAANPIAAASIAGQLQMMFQGDHVVPQFFDLDNYSLDFYGPNTKLVGSLPSPNGDGLLGLYGAPADTNKYSSGVQAFGAATFSSLSAIQTAGIDVDNYTPQGGATYPSNADPGDFPNNGRAYNLFRQLRHGVQLMKEADLQIFGVDLDGFDNHSNQGTDAGQHANLLHILSHAVRSLRLDLDAAGLWDDTLVVVGSEFGRTSIENGSFGTDHAHAGPMFVAGGSVTGGVYNCDMATWAPGVGTMLEVNNRYLSENTDYRTVYAEILTGHFGILPGDLDLYIPNWSTLTGTNYNPLNFL